MAEIVQQVNELANLQNRSEALLAVARQNAMVRASVGAKVVEIGEQLGRLAEVLASARLVSNRVKGANEKQTKHLDELAAALEAAPTSADLERSVDELSAVVQGLGGQPPGAPTASMEPVSAINNSVSASPTEDELPFQDARSRGGYRYSRRRKTPTRRKGTPTRRRRKSKSRRR